MLLYANAWSLQAGLVQFVHGDVMVTAVSGVTHPAHKGDAINEGDTLVSARAASAQIKMNDGGFIAVRPNTRLKFDSFKFSKKPDKPESAFFSLLRGGFRAITGLIGRVRHGDYKIKTPVATIGIRGTDHETVVVLPGDPMAQAGQAAPGAYNKVNVGETSITTNKGTINVLPNQMGFAGGVNQMPQIQPVNTNLFTVVPPPAPNAKVNGGGDSGGESGTRDTAVVDTTARAATNDTQTTPGTHTTTTKIVPPTVVNTPTSTLLTTYSGSSIAAGVYTTFDGIETAVAPHAAGTPPYDIELATFGTGTYTFDSTGLIRNDCGSGCYIDIGTLKNVDVGGVNGTIEWGRWSQGIMSAGGWFNGLVFGPNQGWHYLVGVPTTYAQMPVTGTFAYNLIGGTSPTPSDGIGGGLGLGHLVSGSATINFAASTVNGNLVMGFNGSSIYQATYSGTIGSRVGQTLYGTTTFQSGSINVCGSGGCSTQYQGMLTGNNAAYLGVGYMITTNQNFNINGVAAYKR